MIQQLRSLGHFPISTADAGKEGWRQWFARDLLPPRSASTRDLATATHELAMLLQAGLPLDRALEVLTGMGETQRLREPLGRVLARVRDGAGFADALAAERNLPRLYVSMVRAGETGGSLEATLRRLGEYLGKAQATRDAVTSALIYPAILLATAGLSIVVILMFVLPSFEPLFTSAGKSLPGSTKVLMAIAHLFAQFWGAIALCGIAAGLVLRRAMRRPGFRRWWDAFLLRLPLLGGLLAKKPQYRVAGYPYGPRNGPFQSVDELKLVMGMTPELFARIEPAITVYSGHPFIDPQTAPREALLALPTMGAATVDAVLAARRGAGMPADPGTSLPIGVIDPATSLAGRAFTIHAEIEAGENRLSRAAVIRLTENPLEPYWVLAWK